MLKFRKYLSLTIAILVFCIQLYGIIIGSTRITVLKETVHIKNLPKEFEGFKIIHLSDIHMGSFLNKEKFLNKIVDSCNYYKPDLIVFTGDIVNQYYNELEQTDTILDNLYFKAHKFAVLGNHDFGDYSYWKCPSEKEKNIKKIIQYYKTIHFKVLRNEHSYIKIKNDSIAIVGVDNWGLKPFKQYGDIEKAATNVNTFAIVLSHDPTYWSEKIVVSLPNSLTLSGHTHAFQLGYCTDKCCWSPVKLRYKHWWGLYKQGDNYLYVNRGLGMVGYLMRLGMWPEITLIELKSL
ncbi:MAG: metallophosphoesterase [Bacteroidales bacterium]|nr:metallophosphoesterase [Bacteroidales bacterium]